MKLQQILFSQGFGTRRACAGLVYAGLVRHAGRELDDPDEDLPTEGLVLNVEGRDWPFHAQALVMLHKPAGYECSQKPKHHPSVLTLLPPPLRQRGLQPIGRLDEDTTGLLAADRRRQADPQAHLAQAPCAQGLRGDLQAPAGGRCGAPPAGRGGAGRRPRPGGRGRLRAVDETHLRLTLTEGKYHQVKRMVAAVGNRVEALHRSRFGPLALPADLAPGQWCWIPGWPAE
jgi:16S rRNA pseudouridine516 synthase